MAKKMKINNNVFIGNNSLGSKNLFYSRIIYSAYALHKYPELEDEGAIKNFWFRENTFYGKVDLKFDPIEVNYKDLVSLRNYPDQFVLPFVRDAFEDFERDVKRSILDGIVREFPLLRKLKVVESTRRVSKLYGSLTWYTIKVLKYLTKAGKLNDIKNFEDFMVRFGDLCLEYSENNILTKSSFVMSSDVDLRYTGLALSLANADYSSDRSKVASYINHREYPLYVNLLQKYGFYVDKNAPWRIVANISSAPMQGYLEKYGIAPGLSAIFSRYYRKAYLNDIDLLQTAAYSAYTTLRDKRPKIFETSIENGELVTTTITREPLRPKAVTIIYPDDLWLSLYIKIKNNEKNLNFADNELEGIIKSAKNLQKLFDKRQVLGYINSVFKDIPAIEGSSNDAKLRKYWKETPKKELPFSEYKKYLSETVKKG